MKSRRELFQQGAALGAIGMAFGVAACANPPSASQLVQDARMIGTGAAAINAKLVAAGVTLPANILADLNKGIADIEANAQGISDALGMGNGTLAQKILQAGGVIANLLAPFAPIAPAAWDVLSAVIVLAQGIFQAFQPAAPAAAMMAAPALNPKLIPYSPADARKTLGG